MLTHLSRAIGALRLRALYTRTDFLAAYAHHTDMRVAKDPQEAVGGMWEEIGRLQFDFLVKRGLRPTDALLDIGCGTLRGGRHFIRYLNPGCYTGTDISSEALEAGRHLIEEQQLVSKRPRLVLTQDLLFREFQGEMFNFLLAQSVFTHLPPRYIEECFEHTRLVMHDTTVLYFTFNESQEPNRLGLKDFSYPLIYFAGLAEKYSYNLEDMSNDYPHPRGQRMARLTRK